MVGCEIAFKIANSFGHTNKLCLQLYFPKIVYTTNCYECCIIQNFRSLGKQIIHELPNGKSLSEPCFFKIKLPSYLILNCQSFYDTYMTCF